MQTTGETPRRRRKSPKIDPNVYRANTNLVSYPYFSLEERDRRWAAVREALDAARLDCLIVPPSAEPTSLLGASARYLTQVGGTADVSAIFPLHREPAAIVTDTATWSSAQPWCTDLREPTPSHHAAALVKLHDVGLRRRRIGVVGLEAGEPGEIPAGYFAALATAFPKMTWVDFTRQLDAIRERKSGEEIAFLCRSAAIADAAFDTAVVAARPGTAVQTIENAIIETLCRLGSELPIHVQWHAARGLASHEASEEPTFRAGSPWILELEAAWGGYRVRWTQPLGGEPFGAAYTALEERAADLWSAVVAGVRAGATSADIIAAADREASRADFAGQGLTHTVSLRGCGLGADLPRFTTCRQDLDSAIPTGSCFALHVALGDGIRTTQMEQPVLMTGRGLQVLGSDIH